MIETSIILTVHNRPKHCLLTSSKWKEMADSSVEIIILDDYHISSPTVKSHCEENDFIYIHTGAQKKGKPKFRMPGYALNIGVKHCKGDNIIFGNSEVMPDSILLLKKMLRQIREGYICSPVVRDQMFEGSLLFSRIMNNKLPFCWGMPKAIYEEIGGYDEEFTGFCFDDNDFSDRALSLTKFVEIKSSATHLWHSKERNDPSITNEAWLYNKKLYESKKGILKRNTEGDWGVL